MKPSATKDSHSAKPSADDQGFNGSASGRDEFLPEMPTTPEEPQRESHLAFDADHESDDCDFKHPKSFSRHSEDKHFQCDECSSKFAHEDQLARHKRTHVGEMSSSSESGQTSSRSRKPKPLRHDPHQTCSRKTCAHESCRMARSGYVIRDLFGPNARPPNVERYGQAAACNPGADDTDDIVHDIKGRPLGPRTEIPTKWSPGEKLNGFVEVPPTTYYSAHEYSHPKADQAGNFDPRPYLHLYNEYFTRINNEAAASHHSRGAANHFDRNGIPVPQASAHPGPYPQGNVNAPYTAHHNGRVPNHPGASGGPNHPGGSGVSYNYSGPPGPQHYAQPGTSNQIPVNNTNPQRQHPPHYNFNTPTSTRTSRLSEEQLAYLREAVFEERNQPPRPGFSVDRQERVVPPAMNENPGPSRGANAGGSRLDPRGSPDRWLAGSPDGSFEGSPDRGLNAHLDAEPVIFDKDESFGIICRPPPLRDIRFKADVRNRPRNAIYESCEDVKRRILYEMEIRMWMRRC